MAHMYVAIFAVPNYSMKETVSFFVYIFAQLKKKQFR